MKCLQSASSKQEASGLDPEAVHAPIGFAIAVLVDMELAVWGAALAVGCAMLPDIDMYLPVITHRGITHTIYFVLLTGLGLGAVAGPEQGLGSPLLVGAVAGSVGAASVLSHIAADAVTPMGVDPLLRGERTSFDIVRAANPVANYVLLVVGVAVVIGAATLAVEFGASSPESVDLPDL